MMLNWLIGRTNSLELFFLIVKKNAVLTWAYPLFSEFTVSLKRSLLFCFLLKVLPSLKGRHNEFLLKEFVQRWENHKVMVRWLARVFHYLDRYFISRRSLPSLRDTGISCFKTKVSPLTVAQITSKLYVSLTIPA